MSDWPIETPVMTRRWCRGCEPDVDPTKELLEEYRCDQHYPGRDGAADHVVDSLNSILNQEGGVHNKAWCDFFHRGQTAAQ